MTPTTPLYQAAFDSAEYQEALSQYHEFRSVGRELNNKLVKQLPKAAIEECGKKLGMLKKKSLVLGNQDELSVLMDYCVYHYRRNGINVVSRFLSMSPPVEGSIEMTLLKAMQQAHYSLFAVKSATAERGLEMIDLLRDEEIFLVDLSMSRSAYPGFVFGGHVLPMPGYFMTSGAFLPIPGSILEDKIPAILEKFYHEDHLSPGQEAAFAAQVIRAALQANAMDNMKYQSI
jgi:hypothetical protein